MEASDRIEREALEVRCAAWEMTNFRASLSHTLSGSLQDAQERETAIDRVRAFSTAPRLGTLLYRVKYALDGSALKPAIAKLAEVADVTPEIADLAIHEWVSPECRSCRGAQELIIDQKRVKCPKCEGLGVHAYDDKERSIYLRCSIGVAKQCRAAISKAHATITAHDIAVNGRMNRELERDS